MLELIISMFLWGTLGVFVLWSHLPAIDVTFYRCLIGFLIIGALLLRNRKKIPINYQSGMVAIAGLFLIMNWVFLFKSFQVSTITIGNISYYLQPIILIILGMFFYQEKVSMSQWILIIFALIGVLLTIDIRNLSSPHIILGVLFALFAALLYSLLTVVMKNNKMEYFKVIFIQLGIGVVVLFPFTHFKWISLQAVSCLIIIGLVHTLFAYWLYYQAIKKTNFTQIAIISYLDPLVAIGTDILFFNRHLNFYQWSGVLLTFGVLSILVISKSRKENLGKEIRWETI